MFGMCISSSRSGAPPILCLVRGDSTNRLELQRVADLDKNGVDFMNDDADQSSWFFFATTYRIFWRLKSSREKTLVDTMPMKADGLRMTTSEHDEVFPSRRSSQMSRNLQGTLITTPTALLQSGNHVCSSIRPGGE